jgi:hypothetical protein
MKETSKLNNLQAISFENFIASTKKLKLLQYLRALVDTGQTQIIRVIQEYFLKMGKQ